jgi:hypothetical protein
MEADKRSLSGVDSASCGVAKEPNLALFDVLRWNELNTSAPPQQTPSLVGISEIREKVASRTRSAVCYSQPATFLSLPLGYIFRHVCSG